MYCYIRNSNSRSDFNDTLKEKVVAELKKMRIYSDINDFESEPGLNAILEKIDKTKTNTLVVIGDDEDFELLIGQLGRIKEDLAIGYLPLTPTRLSKALGLRDWLSAIQALSQRKINEIPIYSIAGRYFLSKIYLEFETGRSKLPITIQTEGKLLLQLPESRLMIENSTSDIFHLKKPLLLTAERINVANPAKTETIIRLIKRKALNQEQMDLEQILHLPFRAAKISCQGTIKDSLGRTYRNSVIVGKNSKIIRLITKKTAKAT